MLIGEISTNAQAHALFVDPTARFLFAAIGNEIAVYDTGRFIDLQPEAIELVGPDRVPEESDIPYKVIAYYQDGLTKDVTALTDFAVDPYDFEFVHFASEGLLLTHRLYRMSENCIIVASHEGLTVEKEISIYPVCDGQECTQLQLVQRNIEDAIAAKEILREELAYVMSIESHTLEMITELRREADKGKPQATMRCAYINLFLAYIEQQLADTKLVQSIRHLHDAANTIEQAPKGND